MRIRTLAFALSSYALLATAALAQTADVVVGVPVHDGKAGKPQPGVIVNPEGKRVQQALPAPVIVQDADRPGTTTVKPKFGGGYTVERENGTTTTVTPNFGGGYKVETTKSKAPADPEIGSDRTVEGKKIGAKTR